MGWGGEQDTKPIDRVGYRMHTRGHPYGSCSKRQDMQQRDRDSERPDSRLPIRQKNNAE